MRGIQERKLKCHLEISKCNEKKKKSIEPLAEKWVSGVETFIPEEMACSGNLPETQPNESILTSSHSRDLYISDPINCPCWEPIPTPVPTCTGVNNVTLHQLFHLLFNLAPAPSSCMILALCDLVPSFGFHGAEQYLPSLPFYPNNGLE